jgi:hypothetical protein
VNGIWVCGACLVEWNEKIQKAKEKLLFEE